MDAAAIFGQPGAWEYGSDDTWYRLLSSDIIKRGQQLAYGPQSGPDGVNSSIERFWPAGTANA
jgi:hypothetical protein